MKTQSTWTALMAVFTLLALAACSADVRGTEDKTPTFTVEIDPTSQCTDATYCDNATPPKITCSGQRGELKNGQNDAYSESLKVDASWSPITFGEQEGDDESNAKNRLMADMVVECDLGNPGTCLRFQTLAGNDPPEEITIKPGENTLALELVRDPSCNPNLAVNLCEENDVECGDHGDCVPSTGSCDCDPGYTGNDCSDCATGYEAQGNTCVPEDGGDVCDGVTCNFHGDCVVMGANAVCECDPGYTGGTCSGCAAGYEAQGSLCVEIEDNACEGVTCSNHGECMTNGAGNAVCDCEEGYTRQGNTTCVEEQGTPCENVECGDHGECQLNTGDCQCDEGYTGNSCNTCDDGYEKVGGECVEVDVCEDVDCSGHGQCRNMEGEPFCVCDDGYAQDGPTACVEEEGTPCEDIECGDNGLCDVMSGECHCNLGYEGDECDECDDGYELQNGACVEIDLCNGVSCSGHGMCVEDTGLCDCLIGYTGSACGSCANGFEEDNAGNCIPTGDPCNNVECGDNGECETNNGLVFCECAEGYDGNTCNQCADGFYDLQGNGVCVEVTCDDDTDCNGEGVCSVESDGSISCSCHTGYGGDDCSECDDGFEDIGNGECVVPDSQPTRICVVPEDSSSGSVEVVQGCTFEISTANGLQTVTSDDLIGDDECPTGALYLGDVTATPKTVEIDCTSAGKFAQAIISPREGELTRKGAQVFDKPDSGDAGDPCVRPTTANPYVANNLDVYIQDNVGRYDSEGVCQFFSETGATAELEALRVSFGSQLVALAGDPGETVDGPNGTVWQHTRVVAGDFSNLAPGGQQPVELVLTLNGGDTVSYWVTAYNGNVSQ